MKNKVLEKLFEEYLIKENIDFYSYSKEVLMNKNNNPLFVLGEDFFFINKKQSTIYIKPFNLLLENVQDNLDEIDWIGLKINQENNQMDYILGFDNPFDLNELDYFKNLIYFINEKKIIGITPYSFIFNKKINYNFERYKIE